MTSLPPDLRLQAAAAQRLDAMTTQNFLLFLRRTLLTVNPGARYAPNWHLAAIAEHLHAAARGEMTRLLINLPPRMLKSTMISVAWPAWLLGHDPRQRIMVASYAQHLATKHSVDCRHVLQSAWYRRIFPETLLSADQNEKDRFSTTQRGQRLAVSIGGAAVGEGGNVLIVDDPLNPAQATSAQQRSAVNAWFDHTFASRLDDKKQGCIVVVMQRLHAEDLSGYLLDKGTWEHLCLPAIAPVQHRIRCGNFSYTRNAGEALHPTREDVPLLERTRREMGAYHFQAQYQQAPQKIAGALLKPEWFPRFAASTDASFAIEGQPVPRIVQSWDTGIKAGAQNDPSVCATFLQVGGVHRLIDMLVVRLEYPELKRRMQQHAARFAPEVILVEDKASGQSLLQDLRRETDLPLIACTPDADKITRLLRITPMLEAGHLHLPAQAAWLAAFEAEFFNFPDVTHDDQVDSISQYCNWLRSNLFQGKPTVRRV